MEFKSRSENWDPKTGIWKPRSGKLSEGLVHLASHWHRTVGFVGQPASQQVKTADFQGSIRPFTGNLVYHLLPNTFILTT
jgi:hypothetical protein